MSSYIWVPIIIGLIAIDFVVFLAGYVLRKDTGTPAMRKVSDAIFKERWHFSTANTAPLLRSLS